MVELGVVGKILGGKASLHKIRIRAVMRQVLTELTCNNLMGFDQIAQVSDIRTIWASCYLMPRQ